MAIKLNGRLTAIGRFKTKSSGLEIEVPIGQLSWNTPKPGLIDTTLENTEVEYIFVVDDINNNVSSFSIVNGSLPPGLEMNPFDGMISGKTPSVESDTLYSFRIRAVDLDGNDLEGDFSIRVRPQLSEVVWVTEQTEFEVDSGRDLYAKLDATSQEL